MKYIYTFGAVLSFLLLNSCQSNDNQKADKPVFVNYEVRYLEQENELRALAYFKEGDSLQALETKEFSNVLFQNNEMKKQNLGEKGFRYIFEKKGPYNPDMSFGYKNDKGDLINYNLSMPKLGDISIKEDNVDKSEGITIVWDGDLISSSQNIIIMFTSKDNKATSISLQGPSEASEVSISSISLEALTPGEGQFYIVKKQVLKTENQNQTIQAVVEYYTAPLNINVIE